MTTDIEQEIEELGSWAAALELSAADNSNPYWMRQQDKERAIRIRQLQAQLLAGHELSQQGLRRCRTIGCTTMVLGSDYCPRCEEELHGEPYPFSRVLLGETFFEYVSRIWNRLVSRKTASGASDQRQG